MAPSTSQGVRCPRKRNWALKPLLGRVGTWGIQSLSARMRRSAAQATTAKVARHESDHARKLPSGTPTRLAIVMPVTIRQTSREAWPGAARLIATMAPTPK